ncbi:hypothetical protein OC846_000678 [Tilletia horrida]|uniref:Uncharacterized protein n=1 Tax=Tilletia horrida TaxID=155126 RepID=A0AAN6GUW0_9BASI|nr:hypothetical protein OC846_000678 [Tilletia horrida]
MFTRQDGAALDSGLVPAPGVSASAIMRSKSHEKAHPSPLSPTFPPSQTAARPDMLLNLGSPTTTSAQGPRSPSYPPNSSKTPRSLKSQSISGVKLRRDKGSKDRHAPLSPAAGPIVMDRHVPTYASMPGQLRTAPPLLQGSDSVACVSPPGHFATDSDLAGIPFRSESGDGTEKKLFSKLSHHPTAPISGTMHSSPPFHDHGQDHHHLHHHHQHSSLDDAEDGPQDSFFAHLRAECEDCHEILDTEAVLDRKSPRRRSNLPLPLSIEEEDREEGIRSAGWRKEVDPSYRPAQSLEAEQRTKDSRRHSSGGSKQSSSTLAPLRAEDVLGQRKETWQDYEQEQVLGGFASLGVTPSKARDRDSGSSTGHGGRSRSNTGSVKLGPQSALAVGGSTLSRQYESTAGEIFDGGASSPRTESHDGGDEAEAVDARIAWPATLKARNSDPMETLDILSIEEMGMQSINMGNPDDWEGCIIGPVRPDAPTSQLRLASASEFCRASAGISWAVARFVGQPRKWIVTPLEALRPGQDEHRVACTEARTVVVTDHVHTQRSDSTKDGLNFLDAASGHGPNPKGGHNSVSPFAETTMFNLRFLRAKSNVAGLSDHVENPKLPSAPDHAVVLAHPDAHRKMARAAFRTGNEGSALKSHLVDSVWANSSGVGTGTTAVSSLDNNAKMTLAERRRAADSDLTDFGGFYDPFDSESVTLSSGGGSTSRHGSQNARGSASLSVSSGPSSRSGSSVVGLGFGSNTSAESTQMRNGSVQSEKLNFSQSILSASSAFGAALPITPGPTTTARPYNGSLPLGSASTAAVSSLYGGPMSLSQSPYPPSASQVAKTLRRTRSKPALRASIRDAAVSRVDSPPRSLALRQANSSATTSPSMQSSPHVSSLPRSGLHVSHPAIVSTLSLEPAVSGSELGSRPHSRRPSFGKSPSYQSAVPGMSENMGAPWDTNAMAQTATLMPASSTSSGRRRAHADLCGLDSVPPRSLTMTIPLPLFQLHNAPRPITRYIRITFVPFASADEDEDDSAASKSQADHHHRHLPLFQHSHLGKFGHAARLNQNHSQASALIPMPDDFELPLSPLLTPTATVPPSLMGMTPQASAHNLQQQHQQSATPSASLQLPPAPQAFQSWYRKIANAASARGLLYNHEDGGNGGFSVGGNNAGESSSKDWFKRIGRHHDDSLTSSNGSGSQMKSSATIMGLGGNSVTVSTASAASQKAATDFVHDRCRLPGRRRSGAEAFRVTALVMNDPTAVSGPGPTGFTHPVSRTMSANSGGGKRVGAQPTATPTWGGGLLAAGSISSDGMNSSHVSPRQVQGAFSAAAPETPNSQSPSVESEFELQTGQSGATTTASAGDSAASLVVDWSADLPEPGTFPVVLAYCDGSRARSLQLVPEGWEAIGLGAGAAALGLPGFDAAAAEAQLASPKERGPDKVGGEEQPASKSALPSGALGGVADLIMAACAAVMDI